MRRWSFLTLLLVGTECTGNDYSLGHNTGDGGGSANDSGVSGSGGQSSRRGGSTGQGGSAVGLNADGGSVFAGAAGVHDSAGGARSGEGEPTVEGGTSSGSGGTSSGSGGTSSGSGGTSSDSGGTSSGAPGEGGDRNSRGGSETGGSITNGEGGSAGQITLLPCEAPVTRTCLDVLPLTTLGAGGSDDAGRELEPDEDLSSIFPHPSVVAFKDSVLNAVNASGQIAGARVCGSGQMRAALFEDGIPRDLTEALRAEYSEAKGINDHGMVIGEFAYRLSSQDTRGNFGFIWKDGVMTTLEELGTVSMVAVNNQDQVLISKALEPGPNDPGCRLWNCGSRGLLWRDGVVTDLGTLGGASTTPVAMNNHGLIIGRSQRAGAQAPSDDWYPFVWQDGAMSELSESTIPLPPDVWSSHMWINDAGQITLAERPEDDLGTVWAQTFNEDGSFAGVFQIAWDVEGLLGGSRPVVIKDGMTIPLWGSVGGRKFMEGAVHDMNQSGLIVGVGETVVVRLTRGGRFIYPFLETLTSQAVAWSPDCYLGCCSEAAGGADGEGHAAGAAGASAGGARGN